MLSKSSSRSPETTSPLRVCPDKRASVVVVGGGMAGLWVACQLAKAGVATVLVTYGDSDRGGVQGASRRSAGALNTSVLTAEGFAEYLQQVGQGQTHPDVAKVLSEHLPGALKELESIIGTKRVQIGVALASGSGEDLLKALSNRFLELGGEIVDGWVTRLIATTENCQGVQYESREGLGKILAPVVIIASGGYSGLFANTVRTNCHGTMLGAFLKAGGIACNLEFLFKHGYGNFDTNSLTPTEGLPGAVIYDHAGQRASWLEQLLYKKMGTKTHLQAVQFWLRNPESEFFVDLSYRPLYLKVQALNHALEARDFSAEDQQSREILAMAKDASIPEMEACLRRSMKSGVIDYAAYEELRSFMTQPESERFRVRPFTYFSMGGLGHVNFATNLHHVFVAGEAMHDFGANRVGGLPWSLYLASGYVIAAQVQAALEQDSTVADFELVRAKSHFDPALLAEIQQRMYRTQEKSLTRLSASEEITWLREERLKLEKEEGVLSDGISWLLAAEAILQASLSRTESRGFFYRQDYGELDADLDSSYSCAWFDPTTQRIVAQLVTWDEISARIEGAATATEPCLEAGLGR